MSIRTTDSSSTFIFDDQEFIAREPFVGSFFVARKSMLRAGFQMVERAIENSQSYAAQALSLVGVGLSCIYASVF
jgi:hypothetical protein